MSEKTENVKQLIESLSADELKALLPYLRSKLPRHALEEKWGIDYEVILDAIFRSQDITQRGVRGVIAEAIFESKIVPMLRGWRGVPVLGDLSYDFLLERESDHRQVKIQVKLQRTVGGKPLSKALFGDGTFVVEVQKTRTGTKVRQAATGESVPAVTENTRPYQFGDFDILAVNLQPATRDWNRFMYTVGNWLMPRAGNEQLIEIMQPVNAKGSGVWTDRLEECIEWFLSGEKKVIFDIQTAKANFLAARREKKEGG